MAIKLRELNRPNSSVWSESIKIYHGMQPHLKMISPKRVWRALLIGIIVKLRQFRLTETLLTLYNSLILHMISTVLLYCLGPCLLYSLTTTSSPRAHPYPLFKTQQILDIIVRLALWKVSRLWISKTHTGIVVLQLLVFGFQLYLQYLLFLTN